MYYRHYCNIKKKKKSYKSLNTSMDEFSSRVYMCISCNATKLNKYYKKERFALLISRYYIFSGAEYFEKCRSILSPLCCC